MVARPASGSSVRVCAFYKATYGIFRIAKKELQRYEASPAIVEDIWHPIEHVQRVRLAHLRPKRPEFYSITNVYEIPLRRVESK